MSHKGLHWEWRGFGRLTPPLRAALERLKTKYPEPQEVTDDYLWVPGCDVNVKFRTKKDGDSFKFKRLYRADAPLGIELWLEDPNEEYGLPIAPDVVRQIAAVLKLRLPLPDRPMSRLELLPLLVDAGARPVTVKKNRRQYAYDGPNGVRVIVESAQVLSPERVDSMAVESEGDLTDGSAAAEVVRAGRAVAQVRDFLGAGTALRQLSYLEALALWANGERVLESMHANADRGTV